MSRATSPPVRKIVLERLGPLYPPNILIGLGESRIHISSCSVKGNNVSPSPCKLTHEVPPEMFQKLMASSKFSIHCKGDDAASARVLDAFDAGTIQLFLSDRFYSDIAFFKCTVNWDEVVRTVPERQFVQSPLNTFKNAIDDLAKDNYKAMKRMWELQRDSAPDVLWHVENSRVAHNAIENAIRCLD